MPRQLTKDNCQPRPYNNYSNTNPKRASYPNRNGNNYNNYKNRTPRFNQNENGRPFYQNQNHYQARGFPEFINGYDHQNGHGLGHGHHGPNLESGDSEGGSAGTHFSIPSFSEIGFSFGGGSEVSPSDHSHSLPHSHVHAQHGMPMYHPFSPCWQMVDKLVEFRFDVLSSMHFVPNPLLPHSNLIFNPSGGRVSTVVESVIHYITQPVNLLVNGHYVTASLPMPFAQHICVSMDDGIARYEEVIRCRMDSTKYAGVPDLIGQAAEFSSICSGLKFGDLTRRPKFREGLKVSLEKLAETYPNGPMEMIVSRPTGRAIAMDKCITAFFTDNASFEAHTHPIIQQILQGINFGLAGTPFRLIGHFYRPVLTHASLLLHAAGCQLLETVSVTATYLEKRIYSMAHDSAYGARVSEDAHGKGGGGLRIIDAVSYVDLGPELWGPNLLSHNTRVSVSNNPFLNIMCNPVLNRSFEMFHNPTFIPPAIPPLHPGVDFKQHCRFIPITSFCFNPNVNFGANVHLNPEAPEIEGSQSREPGSKIKLNVLANEFYPLGHEGSGNGGVKEVGNSRSRPHSEPVPGAQNMVHHNFPVPNVAILLANPPHSGPDEIYISCMHSDSEDFYDEKLMDKKFSGRCSESDERPSHGHEHEHEHNEHEQEDEHEHNEHEHNEHEQEDEHDDPPETEHDLVQEVIVSAACLDSTSNSTKASSPVTERSEESVSRSQSESLLTHSWSEEVESDQEYPLLNKPA